MCIRDSTERAGHIIGVIAGRVLLSHDSDMVISAVHGRAHQVYCAGVYADILFIGMLFMNGLCHQTAVGAHHKAAELRINRHVAHAGRHKHFFINLAHAFSDAADRCV